MKTLFHCLLLITVYSTPLWSQVSGNHYRIGGWSGPVFDLEEKMFRYGYYDTLLEQEPITTVTYPRINFPERLCEARFPGIDRKDKFGMVLRSTLTIDTVGCYAFQLASDDGSKLWIDDVVIVENDKPHKWRVKRDTVALDTGQHPLQLWYFNAYINRMGVVLEADYVGPAYFCDTTATLTLSQEFLFSTASAALHPAADAELRRLRGFLAFRGITEVKVIGHTDDRGTDAANLTLSQRQANAVADRLGEIAPELTITREAYGESRPVASNEDSEGRTRNRRVEVTW